MQARAHAHHNARFSHFYAIRDGIDQGSGLEDDLIGRGTFNDFSQLGAQADEVSAGVVDVELKCVTRTGPVRHGSAANASEPASMSKTSFNAQSEKIRRK